MARPSDYDLVAARYGRVRRADPRIAAAIEAALGDARTVVNVGAGIGSYEPAGRAVTAVEPSAGMIARRPPGAAPAVRAAAEALPFADRSFDAAMAVLTVHHWSDHAAGLAELRRVALRQVVFTWDPDFAEAFWLSAEYLPAIAAHNRLIFPAIVDIAERLGGTEILPVAVPADCTDGFLCAYWRRPDAFLDPAVQAGISSFSDIPRAHLAEGLHRLRADLDDGTFWERHADLAAMASLDLGYRLLIAD